MNWKRTTWVLVFGFIAAGWMAGCGEKPQPPSETTATAPAPPAGEEAVKPPVDAAAKKKVRIGVIAKSQSNPVFQAAWTGARNAAAELSEKYGVEIEATWRTPVEEDAQQQADYIEQLANQGYDGIAISCSEAGKVTPAINDAVDNKGVTVVCFDSDAPDSRRMAYHGVDDIQCGNDVMRHLAEQMGGKGKVAILAGNQTAPNLITRTQGVKDEAAKSPEIEIVGVFYHKETPQDAAAAVEQVMQANPDITGWAMIGGWPLFTTNALKWEPGAVKCVAVDALLPQLDYLRSGHVQILLAQQVYDWGHRSVELLVEKIVNNKDPENVRDISQLVPVTKDNVDEFAKNWETWLPKS